MVAGPNGSGKSNIGDSLLFVLGTRSSKSVRADKLDDLIHNPPKGEPRVNNASVKVTFVEDKEEGNFESVEIERTLSQSGDDIVGSYYINGKKPSSQMWKGF
jgi:Chromosome segregation ATPases